MKTQMKLCLCVLACLLCLVLGAGIGSLAISPWEILQILTGQLEGIKASILLSIRIPRVLMAFLVGAALSASGTVMQSVLRNPLASSYTLGVSSGASLLAAVTMLAGFSLLGDFTLPLMGFAGGLLTVLLAMGITARLDASLENQTIILCGMVLSLFVNAILTVLTALSGKYLDQLIFWQMGSFSAQTYVKCAIMGGILLVGTLLLSSQGTEMDLMTFGKEQAQAAGVDLKKEKLLLIGLAALLTGAAVSFAGVVGFVDLIAPHVTRRIFGARHRLTVPMSAVIGGGFMVVADLAARTLLSPQELPVGAVTALIGAPFFAWIYFHKRGGEG